MLAIEVRYLTGRCVATDSTSRFDAEWPPHPARLFSALVAAWATADEGAPDPAEAEALRWLEGLPAPGIEASDASEREVVQVFVPVNDTAVLSLPNPEALLDARAALKEAEEALAAAADASARKVAEKARAKAEKEVDKAGKKLAAAIDKELAPGKTTKDGLAAAVGLLPESRGRQPRTFPSVTPEAPRVVFSWPEARLDDARRERLDRIARRVVRLGHSSSLVSLRLCEPPEVVRWRPHDLGERMLRVVGQGQLDALVNHHRTHREIEPRVMPTRFQRYTERALPPATAIPATIFGRDWVVLRRTGGAALPMVAGPKVARTLRRSMLAWAERAGGGISEALSGHKADGSPTELDHVAFVPLPFVGGEHATGALLGVAMVLPRALDEAARRSVYRPLAAWEEAMRSEDYEAAPTLILTFGEIGTWEIERVDERVERTTLRPETWCTPARVWLSATPVALDRNPGDLLGRDPEKLAVALAEARTTIARACERIGLPTPSDIEILPAAPWAGGAKAKHFAPFPEDAQRPRRVLTHARLEFDEAVAGPILIGAGRYSGLGLFRPEVTHG